MWAKWLRLMRAAVCRWLWGENMGMPQLERIAKDQLAELKAIHAKLNNLPTSADMATIIAELKAIHECLCPKVIGLEPVEWTEPEPRPETKGKTMTATCKLVKKSAQKMKAGPAKGPLKAGELTLLDNENASATIQGADAGGNPVDISTVATLTATSSNAAVFSVDAPAGMTVQGHGLTPGTATVTFVATWNDPAAGIGPFTVESVVTCTAGGPTGITVTWGDPVVRP